MDPKVSIIIINWNGRQNTLDCLESLKNIDYSNYEVIVVDNASSDGSAVAIEKTFPEVVLIKSGENLGWAGGTNLATKKALENNAQYVWMLNHDTVTESDVLDKLVAIGEQSPQIGLLSPVLYYYSTPDKIQYCGSSLDWDHYTAKDYVHLDDIGTIPEANFWLWGTALLIKRSVIERIGYFNEKYFTYSEDKEYSVRAYRAGFFCEIVPTAKVFHKYHSVDLSGLEKVPPHVFYYTTRNGYLFWMENIPRLRKINFFRKYTAWTIRRALACQKKSNTEGMDACLDGLFCGFRNQGGPWDKTKKMPKMIRNVILSHPYFFINLFENGFGAIGVSMTKTPIYKYVRYYFRMLLTKIDDFCLKDKKYVHALLFANCIHILLPILKKLKDRKDYYVTVTAVRPGDLENVKKEGIEVSDDSTLMERFFRSKHKKRLFLNASDFKHPFNKISYEAVDRARRQGVLSFNVQHGLITFFDLSAPEFYMTSDKTAVWGEYVYQQLIQLQKKNPEDLFVTGNPALDVLQGDSNHEEKRKDIYSFLNLAEDDKYILFFSCLHDMSRKELRNLSDIQIKKYLCSIYSAIKKNFSDFRVVIKPHPAEGPFLYLHEEAIHHVGLNSVLVDDLSFRQEFSLYDLIAPAKFVVCYPSTTFLESLLLKKNVVMVNVPGQGNFLNEDANNKNFFVINGQWDNLEIILDEFFRGRRASLPTSPVSEAEVLSVLKRHIYKLDGNASARIIESIDSVLEK